MIYIATDPGVVTGLTTWNSYTEEFQWFEIKSLDLVRGVWNDIVRRAERAGDDVDKVTEKFTISKRTLQGKIYYESLYWNGWVTIEYPDTHVQQPPRKAQRALMKDQLSALGWHNRTKDGHADDAAWHLMQRAYRNREPYVLDRLEFLI